MIGWTSCRVELLALICIWVLFLKETWYCVGFTWTGLSNHLCVFGLRLTRAELYWTKEVSSFQQLASFSRRGKAEVAQG